jgi:hypothetical protein
MSHSRLWAFISNDIKPTTNVDISQSAYYFHTFWCKKIRSKIVPLSLMKAYRGSGSIEPLIPNLGSRWRRAVNLRFWPSYGGK